MAQSGKSNMKQLSAKEGGGGVKEKNKHKKKHKNKQEHSGDGKPTSTPAEVVNQVSAIQNDGAKPNEEQRKTDTLQDGTVKQDIISNKSPKQETEKSPKQNLHTLKSLKQDGHLEKSPKQVKNQEKDTKQPVDDTLDALKVKPANIDLSNANISKKTALATSSTGNVTEEQPTVKIVTEAAKSLVIGDGRPVPKVGKSMETGKRPSEAGGKKEGKKEPAVKQETNEAAPAGEQKSKSQLRAERRAVQEAQRAAKEAKKLGDTTAGPPAVKAEAAVVDKPKASARVDVKSKQEEPSAGKKTTTKKTPNVPETEDQMWTRMEKEIIGKSLKIDNRVLNLGFQYFHHKIVGANARCLALLMTLRELIAGYKTPEEKDLSRDLEKSLLTPCITYLNYCRPISISMGNAIKYLKFHIGKIPSNMDDEMAITRLQGVIDKFITENIHGASNAITQISAEKVSDNDVIMIYAGSSLIARVLKYAHKEGKKFRVIVVEGRPRSEGKTMLRFLVRCGIPCSYIFIGSATYAMNEVTKVFLGAAAMFATGDMYSRSGNSMIAALAQANNIPVLVCCETYKFTDKVQLHTGDSNLHAQGRDLINIGSRQPILGNYLDLGLHLLNVMYDVTSSKHITSLVTEQGLMLASTIPAILRRHEDLLEETAGK